MQIDILVTLLLLLSLNIIIFITKNKKTKEKFIVADAEDINNYKKNNQRILKMSNSFEYDQLQQPDPRRVVDYDRDLAKEDEFSIQVTYGDPAIRTMPKNKKKYVSDVDFGWDPPKQFVSCANSSIAQRYKTGKKHLLPFPISCDEPNKLTAENYYKTHYAAQIIPIEDTHVRGYNYLEYTNRPSPYQFKNLFILSQNTKGLPPSETQYQNLPVGWNYAFFNTPAMPMP
jgi:hypothetical protein